MVEVFLTDQRTQVNFQDQDGYSPLWIASLVGYLNIVHLILASNRSVDTQATSNIGSGAAGWLGTTAAKVRSFF